MTKVGLTCDVFFRRMIAARHRTCVHVPAKAVVRNSAQRARAPSWQKLCVRREKKKALWLYPTHSFTGAAVFEAAFTRGIPADVGALRPAKPQRSTARARPCPCPCQPAGGGDMEGTRGMRGACDRSVGPDKPRFRARSFTTDFTPSLSCKNSLDGACISRLPAARDLTVQSASSQK